MDTDELSTETYKAVMLMAEKFNHNLTLQFGLLSYDCIDDDDYLKKANELITKWKTNIDDALDEIFFDVRKPAQDKFKKVLLTIQDQIKKVMDIPVEHRVFEF